MKHVTGLFITYSRSLLRALLIAFSSCSSLAALVVLSFILATMLKRDLA